MQPPCFGWPACNMFPFEQGTSSGSSGLICPVCDEKSFSYLFVVHGLPIAACRGCGQIALGILPRTPDFSEFYRHTPAPPPPHFSPADSETRSEERRVGKECRSRWSPNH